MYRKQELWRENFWNVHRRGLISDKQHKLLKILQLSFQYNETNEQKCMRESSEFRTKTCEWK